MKCLLDENLPHALRTYISKHAVQTAAGAGLAVYKNGALLKAAADAGFDVLITGDKTLQSEQNIKGQKFAIVVLSAIAWRIIKNHTAKIEEAVDAAKPGTVVRVECGVFRRAKPKAPRLDKMGGMENNETQEPLINRLSPGEVAKWQIEIPRQPTQEEWDRVWKMLADEGIYKDEKSNSGCQAL